VNEGSLLHRQVHPSWIQNGIPSSQVFRPTPKDEGKLSVYDGDLISAESAWVHWTKVLRFTSAGTMSVSASECQELGLAVFPDPAEFPEHAVIDFRGLTRVETEAKAKMLARHARERGWSYRVAAADQPTFED
jgi:hypothetical protein